MPKEMLNECLNQKVTVCVEGELSGFEATVVAVEENWIKVEEKKAVRYINGDMITQLIIRKPKEN